MCRFPCLLFTCLLSINLANSWDIALTHGDQIEFFNNSTKVSNAGVRFKELTALAYDAVHNMLFFVDKSHDNASIFSYNLDNKKFQPLVRRKSLAENIQGLAFDPVTSKLFWTDHDEKSIFWISLIPGANTDAYGNLLIQMDDESPRGIAVDSCRGYIYWTNVNFTKATIERARLDGSERKIIVSKNLFKPVSISIDQRTRKLYWADDKPGIHYTIESSDLDGNNRQLLFKGTPHEPNMITISKDSIYWVNDWSSDRVYKLSKNGEDREPIPYCTFQDNQRSFGIVANYKIKDQTADIAECNVLAKMAANTTAVNEPLLTISRKETLFCVHGEPTNSKQIPCKCSLGYTGKHCDVNVCQNYCINGDCAPGIDGQPICSCNTGFTGTRCEIDSCLNYCLNGGSCSVQSENNTLICQCRDDFEGERCEVQKIVQTTATVLATSDETCSCDSWDPIRDPIMMVLGILCGLLCVTCAVLITKVLHLRRRPRIKKRIIVNKNVTPLTARPDQCEITIENCCNMNICETPCFEPRATIRPTLLDAKPGKEEKRNLIANMENSDDLF